MPAYRIINARHDADLGTYQAASPEAALDALAREAGYEDHAEACEEMPDATRNLRVEEVPAFEGLVTRDEAEAHLIAHPGARAEYAARGPVGGWNHTVCWIDDGELVQPHPTDPHLGPIAAPPGVRYRIISAAEVAAQHARNSPSK